MNNLNNSFSGHPVHSVNPVYEPVGKQKNQWTNLSNNFPPNSISSQVDTAPQPSPISASGHGDPLFDSLNAINNDYDKIHSATSDQSPHIGKIHIDPVQANNPLHTGLFCFPKNKVSENSSDKSKVPEHNTPLVTTQLHNDVQMYNHDKLNEIQNEQTSNENADPDDRYCFVGVHGDEHFLRHKSKEEREKLKQKTQNNTYCDSGSNKYTDPNIWNKSHDDSGTFVGVHGDEHFLRHKSKEEREKCSKYEKNKMQDETEKDIIHVTEKDIHDVAAHLEKGEMREIKAKEREAKQMEYRNARKLEENIAKSSDASLIEKTKAVGNILIDGVKELKEAGLKKYEERKAEKEKEKVHHI